MDLTSNLHPLTSHNLREGDLIHLSSVIDVLDRHGYGLMISPVTRKNPDLGLVTVIATVYSTELQSVKIYTIWDTFVLPAGVWVRGIPVEDQ